MARAIGDLRLAHVPRVAERARRIGEGLEQQFERFLGEDGGAMAKVLDAHAEELAEVIAQNFGGDRNTAVQHRIPADGADPLSLGGVNDANLLELGRRSGLRVVLRDDHLLLSGDLKDVERAVPVAQHMVEMARNGVPSAPNFR